MVHGRRLAIAVLVVATLAGGGLRVDAARSRSAYQSVDERAYARLARNLAANGTYGDPTMKDPVRWAPGAPAVFALAQEVRPRYGTREQPWDVPSAYPVQVVAGTLTIPAAFALAALIAGPLAGAATAVAVAFYPPLVDASGDLLTEPLVALMLTLALLAVALALRRPGVLRGALAGVALALAVLVRADLVLLPLALAVPLLVRGRRGLAAGGAMIAAVVVTLAPWSIYASGEAGRFVPVSSGGASNLYVGTYVPGDGSLFGVKRDWADDVRRRDPRYRDARWFQIPQKAVIDAVVASRPERDREDALRAAALENVSDHVVGDPLGFAAMAARKMDRLWLDYTVGTYGRQRPVLHAAHVLLVLLAGAGLAAALVLRRSALLWVPAVAVLYVSAVNVVLVAEARHNLPFMPALLAGGAAGLVLVLAPLAQRPRGARLTAATRPGATLDSRS